MEIQAERFCMREFRESDIDALKRYQSDHRYLEHYEEQPDARIIVRNAMLWANASPRVNFQLVISLNETGEAIGNIGIRGADYPAGEGELGVEIDPQYWRQGYARDAISNMIQLAGEHGFKRLYANTKVSNNRAISLIQSFGFSHTYSKENDALYQLRL